MQTTQTTATMQTMVAALTQMTATTTVLITAKIPVLTTQILTTPEVTQALTI